MAAKPNTQADEPKADKQDIMTLKYTGKKKITKVSYKGVEYDLTAPEGFQMPKEVAKVFLADGNHKAFKAVK